ncbi:MAG TPA: EamA family transporter, partial [Solirubrobacteraceae bacterium]
MAADRAPRHAPLAPWQLQFVFLSSIWGASFLFIKEAVRVFAPVDVALIRVAFGALVLSIVLALRREAPPRGARTWADLLFVGTVGNAAPFTLLAFG